MQRNAQAGISHCGLYKVERRPQSGRQLVLSGSEDGKAYLWDLQSKQQVQTLEGHSDVVLGVACHPTADMIVTGGMDKDLRSIRVWELQAAAGAAAPAGA